MSLKHALKKRYKSRLPQLVSYLPLFYANRLWHTGKPNGYIRSTCAEALIAQGLAYWTTAENKSVTIKYKETAIPRPDNGCTMGPVVADGLINGVPLFKALVEEWRPKTPQELLAMAQKPIKAMTGGRRNKVRSKQYPLQEAEAA